MQSPVRTSGTSDSASEVVSSILQEARERVTLRRVLLVCGIAAAVWWVAIDVVGSFRYPGYSYVDQTISELSAIGAPTRTFMMTVSGIPYAVLMIAFGVGVWLVTGVRSRVGKIAGALLIIEAIFGYVGGVLFPMATREVLAAGEETLRNRLHAPYGLGMPILFVLVTIVGSRLLGKRFRWYSYATIAITLVTGFMVGMQVEQMQANEPTPLLGIIERITAYVPMLWIVVFALGLLRREADTTKS